MRTSIISISCLAILAPSLFALDVKEILVRHLEANGGEARLKLISSSRTESLVISPDQENPVHVVEYLKAPNKMRKEYSFPTALVLQVFDGNAGWSQAILPNGERRPATFVDVKALKHLKDEVKDIFEDEVIVAEKVGSKINLMGTESIRGVLTYHLHIEPSDGITFDSDIATTNFVEVRRSKLIMAHLEQTIFLDYRKIDGMLIPFDVINLRDGEIVNETKIVSYQPNYKIDDDIYAFPRMQP